MRFYHVFRSAALAASAVLAVAAAPAPVLLKEAPAELDQQLDAAWNDLEYVIDQYEETAPGRPVLAGLTDIASQLGGPLAAPDDLTEATTTLGAFDPFGAQYPQSGYDRTRIAAMVAPAGFAAPTQLMAKRTTAKRATAKRTTTKRTTTKRTKTKRATAKRSTSKRSTAKRSTAKRSSRSGRSSRSAPRTVPTTPAPTSAAGDTVLRFAYAQIGKPYGSRQSGPNTFDCSGLTMAAWRSAGVSLPHSAAAQYRQVRRISRAELRPGDLVFYYRGLSHVGIYAGNSQIIDAPRTGRNVTLRSLDIMPVAGYGRPTTP